MSKNSKFWGVVAAAGSGSRMGGEYPKQYLPILGKPMLHHTLERLCRNARFSGVLAGISPSDTNWEGFPFQHDRFLGVYTGGSLRSETVARGLQELLDEYGASDHDWAMVHDAARPCILQTDIDNLMDAAADNQHGAVLGARMVDTLKQADENGLVTRTVSRSGFWRALTPQVFRIGELLEALNESSRNGNDITDESMAMELSGTSPVMVQGSSFNIKVTVSGDLELAEIYMGMFE